MCSEQYYNLVASAFIEGALQCECLINNGTGGHKANAFCPNGLQAYHFGVNPGNGLPGPCIKPRAS